MLNRNLRHLWYRQRINQARPFVDYFQVPPFQEAAHLRLSCEDSSYQFADDLLLRLFWMCNKPLLETKFALTAEEEHKLHLKGIEMFGAYVLAKHHKDDEL